MGIARGKNKLKLVVKSAAQRGTSNFSTLAEPTGAKERGPSSHGPESSWGFPAFWISTPNLQSEEFPSPRQAACRHSVPEGIWMEKIRVSKFQNFQTLSMPGMMIPLTIILTNVNSSFQAPPQFFPDIGRAKNRQHFCRGSPLLPRCRMKPARWEPMTCQCFWDVLRMWRLASEVP